MTSFRAFHKTAQWGPDRPGNALSVRSQIRRLTLGLRTRKPYVEDREKRASPDRASAIYRESWNWPERDCPDG